MGGRRRRILTAYHWHKDGEHECGPRQCADDSHCWVGGGDGFGLSSRVLLLGSNSTRDWLYIRVREEADGLEGLVSAPFVDWGVS